MPTATEIADALAGLRGPVVMRYRFSRREHDYALIDDVSDAIFDGGSLDLDIDRAVMRTAEIRVDPAGLPVDWDWADVHLGVAAEVLIDGAFEPFPLGLFHVDEIRRRAIEGDVEVYEVSLSDVSVHLLENTTEPYTIDVGDNPITAIEGILDDLGVEHSLPAVPLTIPVYQGWGPGTPWRRIVDALTDAINYYPIWAGATGSMTTTQRISPSDENVDVIYSTEQEPRMLRSEFVRTDETARLVNRAVALIDHPDRAAAFELRTNNDPSSFISIASTGATVTQELQAGIVASTTVAGEWAEWLLRGQVSRGERGELETFFDPRRGAHETYRLTIESIEVETQWRVFGWAMELNIPGTMTHQIGRASVVTITDPNA